MHDGHAREGGTVFCSPVPEPSVRRAAAGLRTEEPGMENGVRAAGGGGGGGGGGGRGWVLVEARLQGAAPWGFTLQGGLEHGEPLIISKVEEGGKADSLEQPLLARDEIIIINDVELTGYRQEAIALVKGSHKTLQLTVRREFAPGYVEEFGSSPPSLPAPPPPNSSPSPPPPPPSSLSPSPPQQQRRQTPPSSRHSRTCSSGGVQLRIKNRRSEAASRPHSWHSTKLGEGQQPSEQRGMDTMSSTWHHSYHASASTTDLSGGFESGGSYLRKSPDQYSSRGSMESLDPPQSSQLHSGAQHHHPLGHHSGPHPAYSSCHQLSSARSSNSIDHLHSKRDSAYSSFSTSSSIPEYLASNPSFSPERSYSLETVPQREGERGETQQADICHVRTVYDTQQGPTQDHELSSVSTALLRNSDSRGGGGARPGPSRDLQGSVGGVCYRDGSSGSSSSGSSSSGAASASNRHSVGPIWGPAASRSSYESLKGAPAPPRRSDSYAAIKHHERPNSWSSLEHARSLRSLQKGSWHHSSGPVASSAAKGSYGAEGQLHTVIEKSPESSPTTRPRQGGGFLQPVPQPEPHHAQMPSASLGPGSSGGHPAPAKESGDRGREEGATERRRDGRMSAPENGYQNNISSSLYQYSSSSASASTQLRPHAPEADRPQQDECDSELSTHHVTTVAEESEDQTGTQRPPNHQGPHSQSFQGSHAHTGQRTHSQGFQERNQDAHVTHIQSTTESRPPSSQWREPCTPVQPRGDRSRSMDQASVHSEPMASSRLTQGPAPPAQSPIHPQPQVLYASASQPHPRHLSDSAAVQYQHWELRERDKDREHPLTRLEVALAEVQRCASPNSVISSSSHGNSSLGDGSQGPVRSLSVLEKVSCFEHRERTGKQRSHSTIKAPDKASHARMTGRSSPCGAEDLRNMLERSNSRTKAHRTMSYRGGGSEHMKYRAPGDPSSALQRSRSTFHLDESKEDEFRKDFPRTQDIQEMLGSMQDTSLNRSYRDSLKDAQSKVLRSTSFRRRDLSSSISPSPPAAPSPFSSSSSPQTPPVTVKHHSLEKKGPKTMPKPQGIVITPQSPPSVISLHTPKERHVVSPETRGPSPPALPIVPPVGPPLMRICGRKRLTMGQKKRSFSEPENMNEVGVTDAETAALFRRGGETSVADRRKMFELVASRFRGGALQSATSRPDLRQLQHDALAEYVERKRSVKRDAGGQRSGLRPRSAYLQPEDSNYTASCHSDTFSLSSSSSLLSLQDSGADRRLSSGERRLPSGAQQQSLQSHLSYRVQRPPGAPSPEPKAQIVQDIDREAGLSRDLGLDPLQLGLDPRQLGLDPRQLGLDPLQLGLDPRQRGLSLQLNGALQRAGSARRSGMSASAEDLLERSEETETSPRHHRSRSSPAVESQDFPPSDVEMFGVFVSEAGRRGRRSLAEDRPAEVQLSGGLFSPRYSQNSLDTFQPAGPSDPGPAHTPVTRRERQRTSERQRTHSTSTLAASVGLPCPLSPPGAQDGGSTGWHATERLSQANLDAITFPGTPQPSTADADGSNTTGHNETLVTDRQTRHSLSDASTLQDTGKDTYRERAYSLELLGGYSAENGLKQVLPATAAQFQHASPPTREDSRSIASSPPPASHPSIPQHLSSLRISESSFFSSIDQPLESSTGLSQEDYDEVFLQNPPPPPPPIIETTSILEDFPAPPPLPSPPPLELEQEATVESPGMEVSNTSTIPNKKSSFHSPPMSPSSNVYPSAVPVLLPSMKSQLSTVASIITSTTTEDTLGLEYQPLPKREKTSEELRVEALSRQLVLQDSSLVPLLDTWGSKSTVELMEEIFPNNRLVGQSTWQRRGSSRFDYRIQDGVGDPGPSPVTDLDEGEKDLSARKVQLCEALRRSVAALRREREALSEEQRCHQALAASVDTLVQERLRPNERDKYAVFIGDLERIVNLLLSLCSRLSRIHRALLALERGESTQEDTASERESLHHKRSLLLGQTEDARELKENLDRRQRVVHGILSGYLAEPQLRDYRRFVSAKPSLLIRQRRVDDLIRQAEETLARLAESLPHELAEARGWTGGGSSSSSGPAHCPSLFTPSVIPGPAHLVKSTTVTSL